MIRRPPRSTLSSSSAASDVYKRQVEDRGSRVPLHEREEQHEHEEQVSEESVSQTRVSDHSEDVVKVVLNLSLIHISEPTRLLSISYAVFCLKKKKKKNKNTNTGNEK
eukprot:TRINITY_DN18692_c0_g1_i6.p1 TRINITY_DN18692_c0_g1~~TRINITY_DN18692_c0_g1_i6.p1  ORF type:complete len:108 (-),score=35.73 TRINITY_DN18692_c0_g1_i6:82-405(-)